MVRHPGHREHGPQGERPPAAGWSPDGTKIFYIRDEEADPIEDPELYVVNADGTNRTRLTASAEIAEEARWSTDSASVFVDIVDPTTSTSELWVIDVATGARQQIADDAAHGAVREVTVLP